ncbi:MAG: hypothetical protein HQL51_08130 [Magnetococcales bacterium]|nr:hypothetical protein [Magnetococcales bacterium]
MERLVDLWLKLKSLWEILVEAVLTLFQAVMGLFLPTHAEEGEEDQPRPGLLRRLGGMAASPFVGIWRLYVALAQLLAATLAALFFKEMDEAGVGRLRLGIMAALGLVLAGGLALAIHWATAAWNQVGGVEFPEEQGVTLGEAARSDVAAGAAGGEGISPTGDAEPKEPPNPDAAGEKGGAKAAASGKEGKSTASADKGGASTASGGKSGETAPSSPPAKASKSSGGAGGGKGAGEKAPTTSPSGGKKAPEGDSSPGTGGGASGGGSSSSSTPPPKGADEGASSSLGGATGAGDEEPSEPVMVSGLEVKPNPMGERRIFGLLTNQSRRELMDAEVTVIFLDNRGNEIFRRTVRPLVVSGGVFGDAVVMLKPRGARAFSLSLERVPTGWSQLKGMVVSYQLGDRK